eukprot:515014-Pelagomonas_calceolata.AAC.7
MAHVLPGHSCKHLTSTHTQGAQGSPGFFCAQPGSNLEALARSPGVCLMSPVAEETNAAPLFDMHACTHTYKPALCAAASKKARAHTHTAVAAVPLPTSL